MLTIHTSPSFFPEKAYIFHVVFREMLGVAFQMLPQEDARRHRICLPGGAELLITDHFDLPEQTVVASIVPHPFQPGETLVALYGAPCVDMQHQRIECGLDLFAAAFFMLSRREENAPDALDKHGRFPAEKSLAFRAGFLHRPVVNEWVDLLYQMLARLGWHQARPVRAFGLALSCDVDHPRLWWSAADRVRTLGGAIFKRGDLREALYFTHKHLFRQKDPYDVFEEWMDMFEKKRHIVQFNFLGERARQSDCWYPLQHPFIKKLMEKIAVRGHRIGFHPGYEAFEQEDVFRRELESLRAVSPLPITCGRQHYLRFSVARTWRTWQDAGLLCDSTLGYPEAEGFRCGICHDYPVFDINSRKMLALREEPLVAMDVTLAQYRNYTPQEAGECLEQLRKQVEKHGGTFTLLWHNSSWNTLFWEPWKRVFLDFIAGFQ